MKKPRIFIGSSKESLDLARAVQENFKYDDYDTIIWNQGVFKLSEYKLSSLINEAEKSDFGIFIFSPDDKTILRKKRYDTVRDNVLFELGGWIFRLGITRCFIVIPKSVKNFHMLPNIEGINITTYDNEQIENLIAAFGPACNEIRRAIKEIITKNEKPKINMLLGISQQIRAQYKMGFKMVKESCTDILLIQKSSTFILGPRSECPEEFRIYKMLKNYIVKGINFYHIVDLESINNDLHSSYRSYQHIEEATKYLKFVGDEVFVGDDRACMLPIKKIKENDKGTFSPVVIVHYKDELPEGIFLSNIGGISYCFHLKGPIVDEFFEHSLNYYDSCPKLQKSDLSFIRERLKKDKNLI